MLMAYESKYTGAEVDALLDKVNEGEAITVDSSLSTTSTNPVQNKVVTEELNKKVNKEELATVNGQSLTNGGNITIEGGGSYDDTELRNLIDAKVDKEEGKGLSTNDYTDEEKVKVAQGGIHVSDSISNLYNAIAQGAMYGSFHNINEIPYAANDGVFFVISKNEAFYQILMFTYWASKRYIIGCDIYPTFASFYDTIAIKDIYTGDISTATPSSIDALFEEEITNIGSISGVSSF